MTHVSKLLILMFFWMSFETSSLLHSGEKEVYLGPDVRTIPSKDDKTLTQSGFIQEYTLPGADLRGSFVCLDYVEDYWLSGNFDRANLEGCLFDSVIRGSFRGAILRGNYIEFESCDITNADISGSRILLRNSNYHQDSFFSTINAKDKNFSNTVISETVLRNSETSGAGYDFSGFNLQQTYFDGFFPRNIENANITGATFAGDRGVVFKESTHSLRMLCHALPLVQSKNYKEKNLGEVAFIDILFVPLFPKQKKISLHGQKLGFFLRCDLTGVDFSGAFFETRNEETLGPFMKNSPVGMVDCRVTPQQFFQTATYQHWQKTGLPALEIVHFDKKISEVPGYKYGLVHVTQEISEALEKQRETMGRVSLEDANIPLQEATGVSDTDFSNRMITEPKDYWKQNLQRCYFFDCFGRTSHGGAPHFYGSDITGATFSGNPESEEKTLLRSTTLCSTTNYRTNNLSSVVFINLAFGKSRMSDEVIDFRNQTLGYFIDCDLSISDFTDAYFAPRDERTLGPFETNTPSGLTECKITMEQFRQTRNYKIWKDRGIPKVEKIHLSKENAQKYNHDKYLENKLAKGGSGAFENICLYRVGNIFVTKEIAETLDAERVEK